jgi:hypothetical protein
LPKQFFDIFGSQEWETAPKILNAPEGRSLLESVGILLIRKLL